MPFTAFIQLVTGNPVMAFTAVMTLGVIFVNGWTDAPNAIATCVSTRSLEARKAIGMAAVLNFLGLLVMTAVNASVSQTIYNMVDFGDDAHKATVALCAAMVAIVLWAVIAWKFGIPTSESHALIAGLTGAAIAINHGFSGVNGHEWVKVLYGLALSAILGFGLGWLSGKGVFTLAGHLNRLRHAAFFRGGQIAAAAGSAFMHGAQDGQKFLGVFLLGITLAGGDAGTENFTIPLWLMALCSITMAVGTSVGGYKIIKSVGMDMVKLEAHEGFAADLAATLCLLLATFGGVPVSTTHTKTTAIMGVGAVKSMRSVNWRVVGEMALAWVMTFPGCGLIGWGMALLFLKLF
ncbi:MAG: inorganic phosphate transporter [Oscillospiraceae bacterium]|jgi:PiT family inorganic phosphate transporter|nr:inorganic phosphate transporter [Oscillospiraceae bacterium]